MSAVRMRLLLAVPLLAGLCAVPAAAGPRPAARSVAPGYDLFYTPANGSRFGVDTAVAGVSVMTFKGVPLRTFDFANVGTRRVGATDTIVRRLDTATPAKPRVRIELVGLLLESTNVPGYFVTLQSARPLVLPSTGTLDISFDLAGKGGMLRSELLVNYDIRYGAPDGPIVYTGSTGMGFVAENVSWLHAPGPSRQSDQDRAICHDAGGAVNHEHCVGRIPPVEIIVPIKGVNYLLNGRDTSADFHPVSQA